MVTAPVERSPPRHPFGVASAARSRPGFRDEGAHTMGDKSPKHVTAKKPATGKSIKEKRLEKKAKTEHTSQMDNLTHGTKRH
jgi:hypothetical protein